MSEWAALSEGLRISHCAVTNRRVLIFKLFDLVSQFIKLELKALVLLL